MSNKLTVDFEVKNSDWIHNFDNEIQVAVMEGNTDDIIERINLFDNVDADSLEFDETNKMFKRPNRMICIQGSIEIVSSWTTEDIQASDIDKIKELWAADKIRSGNFTETATEDAILAKKLSMTYDFGYDYDELAPMSRRWVLATPIKGKATSDNTRIFCMLTEKSNYELKVLDVLPNQTKTLTKTEGKTLSYVFFSQECSVKNNTVVCEQYSVKKLTSESIDIKNLGSIPARLILMER